MKLYREVLIESAGQAEALPVGTIATRSGPGETWESPMFLRTDHQVYLYPWRLGSQARNHQQIVGWSALVPIEAEEETVRSLHLDGRMDGYSFEAGDTLPEEFSDGPTRTRYVTPWTPTEEA